MAERVVGVVFAGVVGAERGCGGEGLRGCGVDEM